MARWSWPYAVGSSAHRQDAEDAFQATFLILARKAGSLRVDDSLAAWLHRVARRVAVEAESPGVEGRPWSGRGRSTAGSPAAAHRPSGRPLTVLHDEIDRLPEKYRARSSSATSKALTRDRPPASSAGRRARSPAGWSAAAACYMPGSPGAGWRRPVESSVPC